MWKKIDTRLVYSGLIINSIITNNPDDPQDQYEITGVRNGYVMALHSNSKTEVKFFPETELLDGTWWIKDKK